jgi:hypothetical protein
MCLTVAKLAVHVHHPVQSVFDAPMRTHRLTGVIGVSAMRGDGEAEFTLCAAGEIASAFDDSNTLEAWPRMPLNEPCGVTDRRHDACLEPAVALLDCLGMCGLAIPVFVGFLFDKKLFGIPATCALVVFQCQHVAGLLLHDLGCDRVLTAHRIDGDCRALDGEQIKPLRDRRDLVRFGCDVGLAEREVLPARPRRDHVDRRFGVALLIRSPQRLAVDGDNVGRQAAQLADPGDEAALVLGGVEGCKNVSKLIVRRRAVLKRAKSAKQSELGLAELRDLNPAVAACQHSEQDKQQDLIEGG